MMYLVRHAEAEGNLAKVFHGVTDGELTEDGRRQLICLRRRFAEIPLDKVYTSPLRRAAETAEAVRAGRDIPLITDARLIEIDGGRWEQMRWRDIRRKYADVYDNWENHPELVAMPDGESVAHVCDRLWECLCGLAVQNEGKDIAIVSHACALKAVTTALMGAPLSRFNDFPWSDNTGVSCFAFAVCDGRALFSPVYLADSSHLPNSENKKPAL